MLFVAQRRDSSTCPVDRVSKNGNVGDGNNKHARNIVNLHTGTRIVLGEKWVDYVQREISS